MGGKKPPAQAIPSEQQIKAAPIAKINGNKHRVVLALDLSSSCVGWGVSCDKEIVTWGKFVFKTTAEVGEKLLAFEEFMEVLIDTYKPEVLVIERPVSGRRKNNQRTIEIVGVLRKLWRAKTGTEIKKSWVISPKTVKTHMNVRRGSSHDENKEIMVNKINQLLGIHLKYHRNSKYESDDDVADALAVLITYLRLNVA